MIDAFQSLEYQIHNLSCMAEIAKVFIADQTRLPLELCPHLIEEQRRQDDCAALLALNIAKMAADLKAAFFAACELKDLEPEEA